MPSWLLTSALIGAIAYLWGGTALWLNYNCLHWGWDWVIYAVLVAVPLIVIGVLATRQQLRKTTCKHRKWHLVNLYLGLLLVWSFTVITADHYHSDFSLSLNPWVQTYAERGFLWSMRHFTEVSNYTAFYNYFLIILGQCHPTTTAILYAIKYLTYLASIAMAVAVALIVARIRQKPFSWWLIITCLLLPPVILESAIWGQCDAIYAALCLFAFYAALKHRSKTSMVLIGLAFTIKFQFIFMVPVLFIMLIIKDADGKHYLRWRDLWLAPLLYAVNLLPVLFGSEFLPLITVYFGQASGDYLSANAATLPALVGLVIALPYLFHLNTPFYFTDEAYSAIYYVCLGIGLIAFGLLLWVVIRRSLRQKPPATDWVYYALLFALTMPFIMPHMHDRFLFLAAVLAMVYVCVTPSSTNYWVAALIIGSQTLVFFNALGIIPRANSHHWSLLVAVLMNLAAWVILLLPLNNRSRKICLRTTQNNVAGHGGDGVANG